MSQGYRFFFSYASQNYENACWSRFGEKGNSLDDFFDELCCRVSDLTGERHESVAYRDRERLRISDFWSHNLVDGLQQSRVLISILSPSYLKSVNCGREFEFFRRRFDKWQKNNSVQPESHRIIPVYWIDSIDCSQFLKGDAAKLIDDLQQKQKDTPDNYPAKGLSQLYKLGKIDSCFALCYQLARRIVELSNDEPLPQLDGEIEDFRNLPSIFHSDSVTIASDPRQTNVFYAVGTKEEMRSVGCKEIQSYGSKPQDWKPFVLKHPGATIELITQEGLNEAGQEAPHHNLGPPEDLIEKIEKARQWNSPILIILDQCVIKLSRFEKAIQDYDKKDFYHVGLVTAGGTEITNDLIAKACKSKYKSGIINHHVWLVPKDKEDYIKSVKDVVSGIQKELQKSGKPSIDVIFQHKPELNTSPVT